MRVGVAVQGPELVVVEEGVEVRPGQAVLVAVLQGPLEEPREQVVGRRAWMFVLVDLADRMFDFVIRTEEAPHEAGTAAERALKAVRKAAYDQVRSLAEVGFPLERMYCSASEPSAGVYFCFRGCQCWMLGMFAGDTYCVRHVAVSVGGNSVDNGSEGRRGRSVSSNCG